jgi:hypothetical protein
MAMVRFLVTLVAAIWTTVALADDSFKVPDGYTLQILEPTGGKIARPNGWFYEESNTPSGYLWTISREEPRDGWYEVGLRIQLLAKLQAIGKISPEAFIENFVAGKKTASARVVSECATTKQGMFQRRCLETEEVLPDKGGGTKRYHIQYSLFWANGADLAVVTTFGAPPEEWAGVRRFAETMAAFELIDMSRFPQQ